MKDKQAKRSNPQETPVHETPGVIFKMPDDGGRYLIHPTSCGNPDCNFCHLAFVPIDKDHKPLPNQKPVCGSIDIDTFELFPDVDISPEDKSLIEAYLATINDEGRLFLTMGFTGELQERVQLSLLSLKPQDVLEGKLISYSDATTGGAGMKSGTIETTSFKFQHNGQTYFVDDNYCPNPKCDCREVSLIFLREEKDSQHSSLEDCFDASWKFSGKTEIEKTFSVSKMKAKEILAAFLEFVPHVEKTFRKREGLIKEVGRQSLLQGKTTKNKSQKKTKPARNSLCPCGSGKKYKKCCGG